MRGFWTRSTITVSRSRNRRVSGDPSEVGDGRNRANSGNFAQGNRFGRPWSRPDRGTGTRAWRIPPTMPDGAVAEGAKSVCLQFTDLTARPIALSHLRPEQPNRGFEIVRPKIGGLVRHP